MPMSRLESLSMFTGTRNASSGSSSKHSMLPWCRMGQQEETVDQQTAVEKQGIPTGKISGQSVSTDSAKHLLLGQSGALLCVPVSVEKMQELE